MCQKKNYRGPPDFVYVKVSDIQVTGNCVIITDLEY